MSRESDEIGEKQFWEQFDREPAYPDTSTVTDYKELAWFREFGDG